MSIIKNNTPWDTYIVNEKEVHVKREDLSSPFPGPGFSKIRGIEKVIRNKMGSDFPPEAFGVVDSIHSKAGWGVSYVCKQLGVPCVVFYPVTKKERELSAPIRTFQKFAQEHKAMLVPLAATKSSVLFYQARKIFCNMHSQGYLFPNGLKLRESVDGTAMELLASTPKSFCDRGTWIVSVSSGTIAAGVALGLSVSGFRGELILHLGFSRSEKSLLSYIYNIAGRIPYTLRCIDEKYEYKDKVDFTAPFPCNPYYDRKAWKWIVENGRALEAPIVFWNVGN